MRDRFERALTRWGLFVTRRPWSVLGFVLAGTVVFATQLQHFTLDSSTESYYHESDPVRIEYDAFRETFGRDATILLAIRPDGGIFEADFLELLLSVHESIEQEIPHLVEVTSLINVRETLGDDEGLEVREFLEDWPSTPAQIANAAARASANPLYRDYLLSADGTTTILVIETEAYTSLEPEDVLDGFDDDATATSPPRPITGSEDLEIVEAIQDVLARHERDDVAFHLAGSPAFSALLFQSMRTDMALFTGLSVVLVAIFLGLLFRRVAGVVLPIVTVLLSVLATLSFMAAAGLPMMPPTQIIPSFLLVIGIGGAVHLLVIFYQARRRGTPQADAVVHALVHSGLPIAMTSLTTAGGLLSFVSAALRPISDFGVVTPIGVLLSLVYVLTVLPALMTILPMRTAPGRDEDVLSRRALVAVGSFAARRAGVVLIAWTLVMGGAIAALPRLELGHDMMRWFPEDDSVRLAIESLNEQLGGAGAFEILFHTDEENGLHDPDVLRRLDEVRDLTERFETEHVSSRKNASILDVVKETHRALNANDDAYYAIPKDRQLIAQELLLFENAGSDDVEDLVTPQFDTARLTVRVPFVDGALYVPYLEGLKQGIEEIVGPDLSFRVTGGAVLYANTIAAALSTMLQSYAVALVIITLLMVLLLENWRIGLFSMIPNLVPVVFALGMMGWLEIQLDMFSLTLGSIVIGIAVDDTIHFMHHLRGSLDRTGSVETAITETLRGTGQALLFTSCVLAGGFLVYTQAYLEILWTFGALIASAIVVAFLADVTLVPAIASLALRPRQDSTDRNRR